MLSFSLYNSKVHGRDSIEKTRMQQFIGVGVIVRRNNKLLLGKRKGAHGAGTWGLPGGHLDPGEDVDACAIRETLEETGMRVESICQSGFTNTLFNETNRQYITLFVEAKTFRGDPVVCEPDKCERWDWFDLQNLPQPLFPPLQAFLEQDVI